MAMASAEPFEAPAPDQSSDAQFILDLDGYEGPIDVLLALAREQKVDLTRISILDLADQYLAFVAHARRLRLELAADYLVMAAWLAYLKSRLLLPEPEGQEEPTGAMMAAALAAQLQRLEALREAAARLMRRPLLGRDVFPRGAPEAIERVEKTRYSASLYDLLRSYGAIAGRRQGHILRIPASDIYSMDDALKRLGRMLGASIDWRTLTSFLPPDFADGLRRRSALAAMLAASLELVRSGRAELRQDGVFGPIYVRPAQVTDDGRTV
jgi:segregation and condensation protein A